MRVIPVRDMLLGGQPVREGVPVELPDDAAHEAIRRRLAVAAPDKAQDKAQDALQDQPKEKRGRK